MSGVLGADGNSPYLQGSLTICSKECVISVEQPALSQKNGLGFPSTDVNTGYLSVDSCESFELPY